MKFTLLVLSAFFLIGCSSSPKINPDIYSPMAGISLDDTGEFVVTRYQNKAEKAYYRLSWQDDAWLMQGKIGGTSAWEDISCGSGCSYRTVTVEEAKKWLSDEQKNEFTLVCIRNIAQAFCRYHSISDPTDFDYLMVTLVTRPRYFLPLKRISR